jgi:putative glutathione S-transferase
MSRLLVDGVWRTDADGAAALAGRAQAGQFRSDIGGVEFPAEPLRYHLFVSYSCPFAHRTLIARALKSLEDLVPVSVVHPRWNTDDGWKFGDTPLSTPDRSGEGFTHLHQAYTRSRPGLTARVTVPVLWDTRTRQIVSDESLDIVRMFDTAFNTLKRSEISLAPPGDRAESDALADRIAKDLSIAVYKAGGALSQTTFDEVLDRIFLMLDELEDRLADGRAFLMGSEIRLPDIVAFTPLVRFDAVYNPLFRISLRRLVDYPRLSSYVRRIWEIPAVRETVRFDHILAHYHDGDWGVADRTIIPPLPAVDFRSL